MRLKSFKVGPYRNILGTGEIEVHPSITVLVGKNESGKTNLLHALDGLNPANAPRDFPTHDYPRWLQKRHQRSGEFDKAHPVEATFELSDEDQAAVRDVVGEGVLVQSTVTAFRSYNGSSFRLYLPKVDAKRALENALDGLSIAASGDTAALREQLSTAAVEVTAAGEPTPAAAAAKLGIQALSARFGDSNDPGQVVASILRERMPRFFYFDDLAQLPGTVRDIGLLIAALQAGDLGGLSDQDRTAARLLHMGYAGEDLASIDYVQRKAELQAVGAELTSDVMEYWRQNPSLRLEIDINPIEESNGNGTHIVRRELKLDVNDTRHLFSNSLDSRSSGFRWFLSFVAAFAEFEHDSDVIVLLDEPGLGLHARAQADFLRFIGERVASRHQVIFTTHSPFMVDPAHFERVRVVEDRGPTEGTAVDAVGGASADPDTLFPLQAALGYDIAQNLFVGPDNLVVEGLSDFTYLTVMSDHLRAIDRTGLDERWRLLPAGGVTNVPTFVALIGPSLDVTVLVDGADIGSQKIQNLVKAGLLRDTRLLTPALAAPPKDADVEDLFADTDYLALYNEAFGKAVAKAALKGKDRIVKRIERADEAFDHNKPARHLLRNRDVVLESMSPETLDRFESLFKAINATLR